MREGSCTNAPNFPKRTNYEYTLALKALTSTDNVNTGLHWAWSLKQWCRTCIKQSWEPWLTMEPIQAWVMDQTQLAEIPFLGHDYLPLPPYFVADHSECCTLGKWTRFCEREVLGNSTMKTTIILTTRTRQLQNHPLAAKDRFRLQQVPLKSESQITSLFWALLFSNII